MILFEMRECSLWLYEILSERLLKHLASGYAYHKHHIRFLDALSPLRGKTSPLCSAASPAPWAIPIHAGSSALKDIPLGSKPSISRCSPDPETPCFCDNNSCSMNPPSTP